RLWPAVTVPVRVFNKHKAAVGFAVFSPDGRQVLSGGGGAPDPKQKTPPRLDPFGMGHGDHLGHDLHLWDFETGKVQRRLTGHTDRVHAAAIAPDGRQALSAGHDGTIRRWDLTTGKTLGVLKGHEKAIRAVAYSPKGPLAVSGGDDHTVRLWDVQAGKQVRLLKGHTKEVRTVAFSPDGRRIASGGRDGVVRVWDVAGGAPLALSNHVAIESVVWFRDGKRVLCAGEGQMRIWDAQEGKVVGTVGGHGARTDRVALLPGERMAVSVGQDGTARFWNLADGREITRWELAPVIPSTSVPSPPRGIYPPAVAAEAPAEAKEVEGKELQPPPAVGGLPPLPPGGRPAVTAPDWTYALSVSPDGRHLVTAGGFSQNAGSSFVNYPTLGERSTMPVPPPPAGVSSPPVQSSRSTMIRIWKVPAVETPAP
ncbi:MAG TPA: WD40 repeat domain-containing protein, partial [Gemmataceae bacterium]|nr:WD40 repeat domain-containing protein [Gemmataceae bacterium]